jgi:hypothetical protein
VRAVAVIAAAVFVALAAGGLVLVEASASPPPGSVLAGAQRFVRGAGSLTYTGKQTVSSPAGGGALLVRPRSVRGVSLLPATDDFTVVVDRLSLEYRVVRGTVWARGSPSLTGVGGAGWVRADSYAGFERALRRITGEASPSQAAVAEGVLLDQLSAGTVVPALVGGARSPHRHGSSVRTLDVSFDAAAVLGPGAGVDAMAGQVTVDDHDRPTRLVVGVRAASTTVDVTYDVAWGGPVTISPPPASEVVASV